mmetsp:Transcript_49335/g.104952  ORF Transcript_49335/g.104952 Transcript_49335/m.104952 type:complete len:108 (+) Transcript_49335:995-1318(+)
MALCVHLGHVSRCHSLTSSCISAGGIHRLGAVLLVLLPVSVAAASAVLLQAEASMEEEASPVSGTASGTICTHQALGECTQNYGKRRQPFYVCNYVVFPAPARWENG